MREAPAEHQHADANRVEVGFSATGNVKSLISDSTKDRMGILLWQLNFQGEKKVFFSKKSCVLHL